MASKPCFADNMVPIRYEISISWPVFVTHTVLYSYIEGENTFMSADIKDSWGETKFLLLLVQV